MHHAQAPVALTGRWPGGRGARGTPAPADPDAQLLAGVRAGEQGAFIELVRRHHRSLVRLARTFVPSEAVAEEVAQDTWLVVLRGLADFEGRSTFRTWLFGILANRARSTGERERRSLAVGDAGPAVDAARFQPSGAWSSPPQQWVEELDERLAAEQLSGVLRAELERLPEAQRAVVLLRDVEGLSGPEASAVLDISQGNQRVLLHRARSRLRQAVEDAEAAR